MALVRLVHPKHYDAGRGRFTSYAYKNLHGGMSVYVRDCAEQASADVCAHARKWYPDIAGEPPIYYFIEDAELPAGASTTMSLSTSGDVCHADIVGASDGKLATAFKAKNWAEYFICADGGTRKLTQGDVDDIMKKRLAAAGA